MNYGFGKASFEYVESCNFSRENTKYQSAEPEYDVCWRVSEANESQTSYSVEQADIFQYQSYSHSDDIYIILKTTINTDTSIFVKMYLTQFLITSAETP
jgi:hypothetical protein